MAQGSLATWNKQPGIKDRLAQQAMAHQAMQSLFYSRRLTNSAVATPQNGPLNPIPHPVTSPLTSQGVTLISASSVATGTISFTNATTSSSTISVANAIGPTAGTVLTSIANTLYCVQDDTDYWNSPLVRDALKLMGECTVEDGESATIKLPDGSVIYVERDGSYRIDDKKAKVIYRANRIRDFNTFLNVSDRLEEFIAYCGQHGVQKDEMMRLPINLFIGWLVIQAARADREPEPDINLLPDLRAAAKRSCLACGHQLSRNLRDRKIDYCGPACFEVYFNGPVTQRKQESPRPKRLVAGSNPAGVATIEKAA